MQNNTVRFQKHYFKTINDTFFMFVIFKVKGVFCILQSQKFTACHKLMKYYTKIMTNVKGCSMNTCLKFD